MIWEWLSTWISYFFIKVLLLIKLNLSYNSFLWFLDVTKIKCYLCIGYLQNVVLKSSKNYILTIQNVWQYYSHQSFVIVFQLNRRLTELSVSLIIFIWIYNFLFTFFFLWNFLLVQFKNNFFFFILNFIIFVACSAVCYSRYKNYLEYCYRNMSSSIHVCGYRSTIVQGRPYKIENCEKKIIHTSAQQPEKFINLLFDSLCLFLFWINLPIYINIFNIFLC